MSSTDQAEEKPPLQSTEEPSGAEKETNHVSRDTPETAEDDASKTLKYSLLGPSLLKAGQDTVDQTKVHILTTGTSKSPLTQLPRFLKSSTTLPKDPNSSIAKKNETRSSHKRSNKLSHERLNSRRGT
jgi:hypothetical protein